MPRPDQSRTKTCPACDKPFTKRPKITLEVWTGQVYCSKICRVNSRNSFWTAEKIDLLKQMAADKKTGAEMAEALGATRNQIVGKATRLKLPGWGKKVTRLSRKSTLGPPSLASGNRHLNKRIQALRQLANQMAAQQEGAASPPQSSPAVDLSRSERVALSVQRLENHHCRFPIGMPGDEDFRFCGAPRLWNSSYCSSCHSRAYTRTQKTYRPFVIRKKAA